MSVTLAWTNSALPDTCARRVLTSVSYMMPCWSPGRFSTTRPKRATQHSRSAVEARSTASAMPVSSSVRICGPSSFSQRKSGG